MGSTLFDRGVLNWESGCIAPRIKPIIPKNAQMNMIKNLVVLNLEFLIMNVNYPRKVWEIVAVLSPTVNVRSDDTSKYPLYEVGLNVRTKESLAGPLVSSIYLATLFE